MGSKKYIDNLMAKAMTDDELRAFIQEDYSRFCSGEYDDNDDSIIVVLHELERREELMEAPTRVQDMTTEELSQIWEDALRSPIDDPVPQIVADVLAELVDREDIE